MGSTCVSVQIIATYVKGIDLLAPLKREGNVYILNVEHERAFVVGHKNAENKWELRHSRMIHPRHRVYDKHNSGLKLCQEFRTKLANCSGCLSMTKIMQTLQLVHANVKRPMKTVSFDAVDSWRLLRICERILFKDQKWGNYQVQQVQSRMNYSVERSYTHGQRRRS